MLRCLTLFPLVLLFGCGEDSSSSGDPTQVTFAAELGVDLTAMERRDSGLYVQDVIAGTGTEATNGRSVTTHYTGWLPNGTMFDTTRDNNETFSFTLGQRRVIAGWEQGISGMKVGGQRKLVIPASLAYGSRQQGVIPPNSVLVFDIELVSVP
jgi:FKBP-type peptidyl-prolyl cis-trans isomerase FkpA